ncbi:MAG: EVE domain-containing protein [Cucumibacter sp.]
MAYWLFKSEPGTWSFDDQAKQGVSQWDGVRNYAARNHMRAMKKGDLGFFYHTGDERRIVGIVRVAAEAHPDKTTDDERWVCVDIEAVKRVPKPVTLEAIKAEKRLKDMALVRIGRLSVQPVADSEWQLVCTMAGLQP